MEQKSVLRGLVYGGVASIIAETFTMPVDVTKVRLQLQGELGAQRIYKGFFDAVPKIARTEGVGALWKGLSPALLRQATYGSLRYGLYAPIKGALGIDAATPSHKVPLLKKVLAGSLSGAVSSAICNPTDLIKIRLQADGMGGGATPRYRGLVHAFTDIVSKEGVTGLWKGVGPTCARASVLAAAELSSYDEIKAALLHSNVLAEGPVLHFATAGSAGFIAALASSPFDVVKSRFMNQPVDLATGRGTLYKGMRDCFAQSIRSEGVLCLWNGFWPNAGRVVPRVIIIFNLMEQFKTRWG
jgi:hypothetical protein